MKEIRNRNQPQRRGKKKKGKKSTALNFLTQQQWNLISWHEHDLSCEDLYMTCQVCPVTNQNLIIAFDPIYNELTKNYYSYG